MTGGRPFFAAARSRFLARRTSALRRAVRFGQVRHAQQLQSRMIFMAALELSGQGQGRPPPASLVVPDAKGIHWCIA